MTPDSISDQETLEWGDAPERREVGDSPLVLRLEGYEGPIDVLLELARQQKVDLAEISILQLVDQFLAFVREAKKRHLALAADYLVMAAWLAYLKSRLLVPKVGDGEEDDPEDLAALLTFRLQQLSAMREAAAKLVDLPRLGLQRFSSPRLTAVEVRRKINVEASLYDLLNAYGHVQARRDSRRRAVPKVDIAHTMESAMRRLSRILPGMAGISWTSLSSFLPRDLNNAFEVRSATASTFGAALELAKQGIVNLAQDSSFADIMMKPKDLSRMDRVVANLPPVSAGDAGLEGDDQAWDLAGELDQAQERSKQEQSDRDGG